MTALPAEPLIADTVCVNYFLKVGEFGLLQELVGGAVRVPRAVFDPDEPVDAAEEALSELRRGLRYFQRRVRDPVLDPQARDQARTVLRRFKQLDDLAAAGAITVVDLTEDELRSYTRLRTDKTATDLGLVGRLGPGEAACLSIVAHRNWAVATDDNDAIHVAAQVAPRSTIWRIRALLSAAADSGLITSVSAREIHARMMKAGFWDTGSL